MAIDSYEFGKMVVDGELLTKDVILLPDRVIEGWRRREGHNLFTEDLAAVLGAGLSTLILGTGADGQMKVSDEARRALAEEGIELIVEPTTEAWRRYNALAGPGVAGAFHLTC